jgi:hypothetical protein
MILFGQLDGTKLRSGGARCRDAKASRAQAQSAEEDIPDPITGWTSAPVVAVP